MIAAALAYNWQAILGVALIVLGIAWLTSDCNERTTGESDRRGSIRR